MRPDHQPVAGRARAGQQLDVAGMQEIEAAIGEADAQALLAPFGEMLVEQRPVEHDLFFRPRASPPAECASAVRRRTASRCRACRPPRPRRHWPRAWRIRNRPSSPASPTARPSPYRRRRRHRARAPDRPAHGWLRPRSTSVMPSSLRVTSTALAPSARPSSAAAAATCIVGLARRCGSLRPVPAGSA